MDEDSFSSFTGAFNDDRTTLTGVWSALPKGRLEQLDDDEADEEDLKSFPRALAFALADPHRRHSALQDPLGGLGYILIVGAPIAYDAALGAVPMALHGYRILFLGGRLF